MKKQSAVQGGVLAVGWMSLGWLAWVLLAALWMWGGAWSGHGQGFSVFGGGRVKSLSVVNEAAATNGLSGVISGAGVLQLTAKVAGGGGGGSGNLVAVDTVAALRALDPAVVTNAMVRGYAVRGDWKAPQFFYVTNGTAGDGGARQLSTVDASKVWAVVLQAPVMPLDLWGFPTGSAASDDVKVKSALAAAAAYGVGVVHIGPGEWNTAGLVITNGVTLRMDNPRGYWDYEAGRVRSVLRLANGANAPVISVNAGVDFRGLNLAIFGNRTNQSSTVEGIVSAGSTGIFELRQCYVSNARGDGISTGRTNALVVDSLVDLCTGAGVVTRGQGARVEEVEVERSGSHGLVVEGPDVKLERVWSHGNRGHGILTTNTINLEMERVKVLDNFGAALHQDAPATLTWIRRSVLGGCNISTDEYGTSGASASGTFSVIERQGYGSSDSVMGLYVEGGTLAQPVSSTARYGSVNLPKYLVDYLGTLSHGHGQGDWIVGATLRANSGVTSTRQRWSPAARVNLELQGTVDLGIPQHAVTSRRWLVFHEEFISATIAGWNNLQSVNASAAVTMATAAEENRPGIGQFGSVTAGSFYVLGALNNSIIHGTNGFVTEADIRFPVLSVATTEEYSYSFGVGTDSASIQGAQQIIAHYTHSVNSGQWILRCRTTQPAQVQNDVNTTVAVAANTWYNLYIEGSPSRVDLYIDGVLAATQSTAANIPSGVSKPLTYFSKFNKILGSTTRNVQMDWWRFVMELNR